MGVSPKQEFTESGAKRQETLPESGGLLVFWQKYCIMVSE
jgi:hypothetical protein